jgi:hypothetical protein
MAALLAIGAPDTIGVVIRQSLVKLQTPDDRGGRVFAVNSMFTPTSNHFGTFRAGTAAGLFGDPGVLIGRLSTMAVVLIPAGLFRGLWANEGHEPGQPAR